ncbi:MAG: hypothetical protein ACTHJR_06865 [Sphingomonas sp.]
MTHMFNVISIVIGVILLVVTLVALVPFLGWLNWLGLVIGAIGLVFGALSRNKAGLVFNLVLMAVAAFRLFLGGGIL